MNGTTRLACIDPMRPTAFKLLQQLRSKSASADQKHKQPEPIILDVIVRLMDMQDADHASTPESPLRFAAGNNAASP
jgi:hypothetical protein